MGMKMKNALKKVVVTESRRTGSSERACSSVTLSATASCNGFQQRLASLTPSLTDTGLFLVFFLQPQRSLEPNELTEL